MNRLVIWFLVNGFFIWALFQGVVYDNTSWLIVVYFLTGLSISAQVSMALKDNPDYPPNGYTMPVMVDVFVDGFTISLCAMNGAPFIALIWIIIVCLETGNRERYEQTKV